MLPGQGHEASHRRKDEIPRGQHDFPQKSGRTSLRREVRREVLPRRDSILTRAYPASAESLRYLVRKVVTLIAVVHALRMPPVTILAIELGIVVHVRIGQIAVFGRIIAFSDFLETSVTLQALFRLDGL